MAQVSTEAALARWHCVVCDADGPYTDVTAIEQLTTDFKGHLSSHDSNKFAEFFLKGKNWKKTYRVSEQQ